MATTHEIPHHNLLSRLFSTTIPQVQASFFLLVLRLGIGLLFAQHGAQKLFGWLGGVNGTGGTVELMSRFGVAGVLEFFGGLLVAVGLFTRPMSFVLTILMIVAYFLVHAPMGGLPIQNNGELAILYAFGFLYLTGRGAGAWSLDHWIYRQRTNPVR